jgi:hypothetical protein
MERSTKKIKRERGSRKRKEYIMKIKREMDMEEMHVDFHVTSLCLPFAPIITSKKYVYI